MLPRYLFADVDDTFTVRGGIHPEVLDAVARAERAGIEVILNTGRPAGYGATLLAYLPMVSAVIVENGGAWLDRHTPAPSLHTADGSRGSDHEHGLHFFRPLRSDLRMQLGDLQARVARRLGRTFCTTADNQYRVSDYTVVRDLPGGVEGAALLAEIARLVDEESNQQGQMLASSIHIHFMLDGAERRSKASGAEHLLARRGIRSPAQELAEAAVAVGDSANDASLFAPGRFALSVGVRNIERYLPELGASVPKHITTHHEGLGLCELIGDLLGGRIGV
ncbi:MAG: HAD hydrolase family protein [Polyangia bacterium]